MIAELPLDKLILDTGGSKYNLVIQAAEKARQLKQQKKERDSAEKITILALTEVLKAKYEKQQKGKEKKSSSKKK